MTLQSHNKVERPIASRLIVGYSLEDRLLKRMVLSRLAHINHARGLRLAQESAAQADHHHRVGLIVNRPQTISVNDDNIKNLLLYSRIGGRTVGQSVPSNALMARNYLSFQGLHARIASLLGEMCALMAAHSATSLREYSAG